MGPVCPGGRLERACVRPTHHGEGARAPAAADADRFAGGRELTAVCGTRTHARTHARARARKHAVGAAGRGGAPSIRSCVKYEDEPGDPPAPASQGGAL